MPVTFGEVRGAGGWGGGKGQERIQNGMPHLTMGLYKMQTYCGLLFLGLENIGTFVVTFKSHNGTETEMPSLALGICEFHQSYF